MLAQDLFRRHVQWGSRALPDTRERRKLLVQFGVEHGSAQSVDNRIGCSPHLGHTPVQHNHLAELTHPDIFRFQVTMHHAVRVCISTRLARLHGDVDQPPGRKLFDRDVVRPTESLQNLEQVLARDAFHRKKQPSVLVPPDLVNRHGIGML